MTSVSIKISNHIDDRISYLSARFNEVGYPAALPQIISSNGTEAFEAKREQTEGALSGSITYDVNGDRLVLYWNYQDHTGEYTHSNSYWTKVSNEDHYRCEPSQLKE